MEGAAGEPGAAGESGVQQLLSGVCEPGWGYGELVPLDSLHSLPRLNDVVLLPGGACARGLPGHGAYRVLQVEHLYARDEGRKTLDGQARLVKTVAHVEAVG